MFDESTSMAIRYTPSYDNEDEKNSVIMQLIESQILVILLSNFVNIDQPQSGYFPLLIVFFCMWYGDTNKDHESIDK